MKEFDGKVALVTGGGSDANGQQRNKLFPTQVGFKKRGKAGIEVSDWLPHLGECIDDVALIRSMYTTDDNHGAQTQFHTGRHMLDGEFPTLGAWVHYGLGSLNDNLPPFVSMGKREYWNLKDGHYLGPAHDAVPVRVDPANPLDYGKPEGPVSAAEQKIGFGLVDRLNKMKAAEYPGDTSLDARIKALRTGLPDAEVTPRGARLRQGDGGDQEALRDRPAGHAGLWDADAGGPPARRAGRSLHPGATRGRRGRAWDAHGGLRTTTRPTARPSISRSPGSSRT